MLYGNILTPRGWRLGTLEWRDGRIAAIGGEPVDPTTNAHPRLLPGFVDLHVHGGGGADAMEGGDAAAIMARTHVRFGTTSLLVTTMTAPLPDIRQALRDIARTMDRPPAGAARLLGVHLEGPYLNPGKLGAQPPYAHPGAIADVEALMELAPIRLLTLAPELSGHAALIGQLRERGVRVQMGHTLGSYEEGVAGLEHGAHGFTHLFNAMTGLHHRKPGMVGAALAHADYAEIIPDLLHVHPGAIRTALRCIPHLFGVTDSTAAAGMPDGEYRLGEQHVTKCLGGVRLADGTLAGSTLTMDQALRNLVQIGLELDDASRRLSQYPADFLGESEIGRIEIGCRADVVVMDARLEIDAVYVGGERVHRPSSASGDPTTPQAAGASQERDQCR